MSLTRPKIDAADATAPASERGTRPERGRTDVERAHRARATAAMDRYADGDDDAFDELYDLLVPRLLPYAIRRTREVARAEDLVQQVFLQMHLARDSFRRGSDVLSWAFAITTRLAIDAFRRRKSEVLANEPHDLVPYEPSLELLPEEVAATKELALVVERALAAMPEGQREAYELVREQGFAPAEAAQILGTSQNAVNLRVHRAYDVLREAIARASSPRHGGSDR
jgi:RNA polymerase sigma-70 factor (ECF subfamily)